jgi:hypothetical protein
VVVSRRRHRSGQERGRGQQEDAEPPVTRHCSLAGSLWSEGELSCGSSRSTIDGMARWPFLQVLFIYS